AGHGSNTITALGWDLVGLHFGEAAFGRRSGGRLTGSPPHPAGGRGSLCIPSSGINRRIDRGVGQRVGEMTIKEFVDRLADLLQTLTLGRSVSVAATRAAETMLPARHLSA